jgi:hypothetical protein
VGKLVNSKFLRLGFNTDWECLGDGYVGWSGSRVLRDSVVNSHVRGLVRDLMRKEEDSFRDWGLWFDRCELYVGEEGRVKVGIFIYEAEIDDFCGRVVYREMYESRMERRLVRWLRKGIYDYMGKIVELDFLHMFGKEVQVVVFPLRLKELTARVLGELIVRRVYDGEKIGEILKDLKRSMGLERVRFVKRRRRIKRRFFWRRRRNKVFLMAAIRMEARRRRKYRKMTEMRFRYEFMRRARNRVFKRRRKGKRTYGVKGKGINGLVVCGNGMFVRKHKSMSQFFGLKTGYTALSSIQRNIEYCERYVNLRTSKCGIKVWLDKDVSVLRGKFRQSVR